MERISLRMLITGLLLAVVLITVAHSLVSQYQFRRAALDYHDSSMSRVVEVATQEVLRQARGYAIALGSSVQKRLTLHDAALLHHQLDDPFSHGYGEAGNLDLVALRAYDPNFVLLGSGSARAIPPLPSSLLQRAAQRQGIERIKTIGGLWSAQDGALYSVLLPIGGLQVDGYLEVVIDPLYNLHNVGGMINLPFGIHNSDDVELLRPATIDLHSERYAALDYTLRDIDGQAVLRLIAYVDVDPLHSDMRHTQLTTTLSFVTVTGLVMLLALRLLQRHLFRPVHNMIDGMEQALHNPNCNLPTQQGIREVRIVAIAFNTMAARVRGNIQELRQLSALDGLTGIANRRIFTQTLEREWLHALRHNTPIALLLIDIDYFKQYNDNYGHQAGDTCLVDVASALSLAVQRPNDLVARYGGEEFVVLLPDTDLEGAGKVAERLQQVVAALAIPHHASGVSDIITMSIGVSALIPVADQLNHWLVAGADLALYRAKELGRNRIEYAQASDWTALSAATNPRENS